MKTIEIWDKKSSINGVSASDFLESNPFLKEQEVILILSNGAITNVEAKSILCNNYGFDFSLTTLEVGELYLAKLEEQANTPAPEDERDRKIRELEEKLAIQEQAIADLTMYLASMGV